MKKMTLGIEDFKDQLVIVGVVSIELVVVSFLLEEFVKQHFMLFLLGGMHLAALLTDNCWSGKSRTA